MVPSYAVPHGLIEVKRLLHLDGGLVFLNALTVKPAGEALDPSVVGISSAHRSFTERRGRHESYRSKLGALISTVGHFRKTMLSQTQTLRITIVSNDTRVDQRVHCGTL